MQEFKDCRVLILHCVCFDYKRKEQKSKYIDNEHNSEYSGSDTMRGIEHEQNLHTGYIYVNIDI